MKLTETKYEAIQDNRGWRLIKTKYYLNMSWSYEMIEEIFDTKEDVKNRIAEINKLKIKL